MTKNTFFIFVFPFISECKQRQTSNMKLSKYIVLSLLLFMCHPLNWVHCSDIKKTSSDIPPEIPKVSSDNHPVAGQNLEDIPSKDGLSKSTCLDGNCNESGKGGEKPSTISSEFKPNYKKKSSIPVTDSDKDDKTDREDSSRLNIFSNYDRTIKGYLTKNDVASFLEYKSGGTTIATSVLEKNLFISCLDTDLDGKISQLEYSFATSGQIKHLMMSTFNRLRSENIDCIYEEDLELMSDNVEFDFLLLDSNNDDCFSFDEFEEYFYRFGFDIYSMESNIKPFNDIIEKENALEDNNLMTHSSDDVQNEPEKYLDLDYSEGLDFTEIKEERKYSSIEEAIDELWESIDENEDGYLSEDELVADLEWYGFQAAEKVAVPLFSLMDRNIDGMISSEELKMFFKNPPTKNAKIKEWMDTFWEVPETQGEGMSHPLNFQKIKSLAFMMFDTNRNDYIDWKELKHAMESHRKYQSDALADSVTDYIDVDKDARISLVEFSNALGAVGLDVEVQVQYVDEFGQTIETTPDASNLTSSDVALAFERLDENRDGFIVSSELKYFLKLRMELLTDDDLKEIFNAYDVNKNGLITMADVQTFMSFSTNTLPGKEEINIGAFQAIINSALKETVTNEEVNLQFLALDINQDDFISSSEFQILEIMYGMSDESEFITWVEATRVRKEFPLLDDEFSDAFEFFDHDRNDYIDEEEFEIALTALKSKRLKMTKVDEYFKLLDLNGDDFISMNEFDILLWH